MIYERHVAARDALRAPRARLYRGSGRDAATAQAPRFRVAPLFLAKGNDLPRRDHALIRDEIRRLPSVNLAGVRVCPPFAGANTGVLLLPRRGPAASWVTSQSKAAPEGSSHGRWVPREHLSLSRLFLRNTLLTGICRLLRRPAAPLTRWCRRRVTSRVGPVWEMVERRWRTRALGCPWCAPQELRADRLRLIPATVAGAAAAAGARGPSITT